MAIDTTSPRTRRAILLGAMGGVAASVAAAAGRATPVSAADGDIVHVGSGYTATAVTQIDATGAPAFVTYSDTAIGLQGQSSSSYGVFGMSDTNYALYGYSVFSNAVRATNSTATEAAIVATSPLGSTAVMGFSGAAEDVPAASAKTGVFGCANQDATSVGVRGKSSAGTGGLFKSDSGIALRATGRVKFDNAAGVATIAVATNKVTVTPGTDLTATSAVVATMQGIPSGTALVKSVAVNPTANTFTIYLTANATHATKVAWHVFG